MKYSLWTLSTSFLITPLMKTMSVTSNPTNVLTTSLDAAAPPLIPKLEDMMKLTFGPLRFTKVIAITCEKGSLSYGYGFAEWFEKESANVSCLEIESVELSVHFTDSGSTVAVGLPKYDTLNTNPSFADICACPSKAIFKSGVNTMHLEGTMLSIPQYMSKMVKPTPMHTKPLAVLLYTNVIESAMVVTLTIQYSKHGVEFSVEHLKLKAKAASS